MARRSSWVIDRCRRKHLTPLTSPAASVLLAILRRGTPLGKPWVKSLLILDVRSQAPCDVRVDIRTAPLGERQDMANRTVGTLRATPRSSLALVPFVLLPGILVLQPSASSQGTQSDT